MVAAAAAPAPSVASRRGILVIRALGALALLLSFGGTLQAQTVTLAWDANTEPDLAGYVVYYGTTSGVYSNNIDVGIVTTTTIGGLNVGQPYYFALKAYDTAGNYSPYSNEVNSASLASAQLTTPAPGTTLTGSTVTFRWTAGTNVPSYQLTVGTTPGGGELFDQVLPGLSVSVTGLPTNGSPVYVRLWSLVGSLWFFRDYTYTAATQGPTVTVSPATVNPGDVITATMANGPGHVWDWVSLVPVTAPDSSYVAWRYLNGLTSPPATGLTGATVQFTAPTTPGTYHIRWFANGTYARLATSSTVTVQATQPLTPTVSVSPATVNPGDVITATVAAGPGNVLDWVSIDPVTAPDSGYVAWRYLNGLTSPPATGLTSATVQFTAPAAPGTYNLRFFANNTYTKLATSAPVTVQGLVTGLIVSPATVRPGDTITVTVANGPGNLADWVAFSPVGAPDSGYVAWQYLSGLPLILPPFGLTNATLHFTAPATPGTYTFRFYANNSYTKLATGATVTVQ
jgi:fibronectin type III domain protein